MDLSLSFSKFIFFYLTIETPARSPNNVKALQAVVALFRLEDSYILSRQLNSGLHFAALSLLFALFGGPVLLDGSCASDIVRFRVCCIPGTWMDFQSLYFFI
eukprot:TRINITY_DN10603_c0_g1_i1.p5 TRINITY_DN10603_c0_g1~~TRINITY_DN10603_c0_g1_i1.p5  ORF type:complete len:102 (-),score=3.07 TRINITY_DN10603_c0_g1_i1:210-515(-)